LASDGRAVGNAIVMLSGDALVTPLSVRTTSFGSYRFSGLRAGVTYVVSVSSERFTFTAPSRVVNLSDNVYDADFVADLPGGN
jgi:hypothetical protein